ncbi:SAM-dependent methyltransferase [Altererythrobacter sp. B11]|uniref:class I SAM-dependent methyltransferase n=1 Tax=Altererythrobacter sp. B11 TaxID=2060312 RepID=UPI000DC6F725|nr:class I SAM-dependent methyltransferase [Altererythrobacter sp. B11]BBC72038.1 SAM-dependent methyltransferase [Altererythrobacter sp. B11]
MTESPSPRDPARFFDRDMAAAYDQRNSGLKPISDCLHFLTGLVLTDLPDDARLLCVGVGTAAEILSLAQDHPGWSFVGVDPSAEMLEVARKRLEEAGLANRCELVAGYVEDVPEQGFDAVTAMLVAHFIPLPDRPAFYSAIHQRLRPDGRFVSAEISCELDAPDFAAMLQDWGRVQARMGATEASLASLPDMLRNVLSVVSPGRTADLWNDAGFTPPVEFFQAFMIRGWHAQKRATPS